MILYTTAVAEATAGLEHDLPLVFLERAGFGHAFIIAQLIRTTERTSRSSYQALVKPAKVIVVFILLNSREQILGNLLP